MILEIINPVLDIILISIIGLVAWFLLLRAAIRADTIKDRLNELSEQQRATNWFLMKLCEKQGVSEEEINAIKKTFNIK